MLEESMECCDSIQEQSKLWFQSEKREHEIKSESCQWINNWEKRIDWTNYDSGYEKKSLLHENIIQNSIEQA